MLIIGFWPATRERRSVGFAYRIATCMKPIVEKARTAAIQIECQPLSGTRLVMITRVR